MSLAKKHEAFNKLLKFREGAHACYLVVKKKNIKNSKRSR